MKNTQRVVLVAKTSDFENADYLDPRALLAHAGIQKYKTVEIFNTSEIEKELHAAKLMIFTTGVFSDPTLAKAFKDGLAMKLQQQLVRGLSVIILSQRGLADAALTLPGFENEFLITPRPESTGIGKSVKLATPDGAEDQTINWTPNLIDFDLVAKTAQESSLKGVYWHSWEVAHPEYWRSLLTDASNESQPNLLIEHVASNGRGRLILSSIALDFTRNFDLFTNLAWTCLNGDGNLAAFTTSEPSEAFVQVERMLHRLNAFPVVYDITESKSLELAEKALLAGRHDSLLQDVNLFEKLPDSLQKVLEKRLEAGSLAAVYLNDFDQASASLNVTLKGSPSAAKALEAVAKIKLELKSGFVANSIFDTAKPLIAIQDSGLHADLNGNWANLENALKAKISKSGTFEGSFVVSSTLVWLATWVEQASKSDLLNSAVKKNFRALAFGTSRNA